MVYERIKCKDTRLLHTCLLAALSCVPQCIEGLGFIIICHSLVLPLILTLVPRNCRIVAIAGMILFNTLCSLVAMADMDMDPLSQNFTATSFTK